MSYESLADFGQSQAVERAATRIAAALKRTKLRGRRRLKLPVRAATVLKQVRRPRLPMPSVLGDLPEPEEIDGLGFSLKRPKWMRKLTIKKVLKPVGLIAAGALLAPVILPAAGVVAGGAVKVAGAAGRGIWGAGKGLFGKWKVPKISTKPVTIPTEVVSEAAKAAAEAATAGAAALTARAVRTMTEALTPSAPVPTPPGPTAAPGYEGQTTTAQPAGAPSNLPMMLGIAAAAGLGLMLVSQSRRSRA